MWSVELKISAPASELFRSLRRNEGAFWVDAALGGGASFMSFGPSAQLWVDGRGTVHTHGIPRPETRDPAQAIEEFVGTATPFPNSEAPRTVGFLGYELGPQLEPALRARTNPNMPRAFLSRYDAVLTCLPWEEAVDAPAHVRVDAISEEAGRRLTSAILDGVRPERPLEPRGEALPAHLVDCPEWTEYKDAVVAALAYIAAGDVYQVNLARRFVVESATPPAEAYLALRATQPVPFGAFIDCGEFALLSNSPERFLRVRDDVIQTEPIKGTRTRHPDPAVDAEIARTLVLDPKERAEHVMIVDLERNDLGRICQSGSVCVSSLLRHESFATLHHLVSTVEGRLSRGIGLAQVLRATFPGGSITGAPKIRATEIIHELEPHCRGAYTGSFVWFRDPRHFDSSIAIRTAVAEDGRYSYFAGGGVVADSRPDREWNECWLKARAFLTALLGPEADAKLDEATHAAAPRPESRIHLADGP